MTQVQLHRKTDGTWQIRWQLAGDETHAEIAGSASEAARFILGLGGNVVFVRGLRLPLE